MSSSDAQKSTVHATTEDSNTEPTGAAAGTGAPPGKTRPDAPAGGASPRRDFDDNASAGAEIGGGPGAGDASSGGGAGAGIPGGGTDMRTDGAFSGGDLERDRKNLFPEARTHRNDDAPGITPRASTPGNDDTRIGTDRDDSTYGGPLNLDDPDNV